MMSAVTRFPVFGLYSRAFSDILFNYLIAYISSLIILPNGTSVASAS